MIIYYVQYLTVNISVAINVQYQECYIYFFEIILHLHAEVRRYSEL